MRKDKNEISTPRSFERSHKVRYEYHKIMNDTTKHHKKVGFSLIGLILFLTLVGGLIVGIVFLIIKIFE